MLEKKGVDGRLSSAIRLFRQFGSRLFPGMLACLTVSLAATFLADHYGAPAILFALLLGMAFHFLSKEDRCAEGIAFTSSWLLRFGVALLGARITADQVAALGWEVPGIVIGTVIATLAFGVLLCRVLGRTWHFGVLTGGAVAICGASAALAIASVLPRRENAERDLVFTVVGVTTLSSIVMVLYPILTAALGLDARAAGIFLGGAIHDVAQVVGAGYAVSEEVGDVATVVKLLRVSMLLPLVLLLSLALRRQAAGSQPPRPFFLLGFALVATMNSFELIPEPLRQAMVDLSRWCLVAAIAAVGMKTALGHMAEVGRQAVLLMLAETVFLGAIVLLLL